MMNRDKRIEIFKDTEKESKDVRGSMTTWHEAHEMYPLDDLEANIFTVNLDTVSAAHKMVKSGRTCVLNMASAKHAGGGVRNGAQAQEECLFRCSNLCHTVKQEWYPLDDDVALYTRDAYFFKDKDYNYLRDESFKADVVTIPAVNLNKKANYDNVEGYTDDEYEDVMEMKMRLLFWLAAKNGCENIVLGAWGCGVFKNDPQKMCNFFRYALYVDDFACKFKNVVFAVINDHNSVGDNYDIFCKNFEEKAVSEL